jgi:hypothetical protein
MERRKVTATDATGGEEKKNKAAGEKNFVGKFW